MNGLIRFALGIADMPSTTIAELDRSLPGFARLADAAKAAEPILRQAGPLIEQASPHMAALAPIARQLLPLAQAAWPIVQKAYPDIVAVTPTVEDLIAFVRNKKPT